jgi:hypothetical protein
VKVTCAEAVCAVVASIKEVVALAAQAEREAQAALAVREAQESMLKGVAESAASLAFVCGKADESAQKVALVEGKVTDTC